jgi:PAS fold
VNGHLLTKAFRDITHPDDLDISLDHFLTLVRGELPSYSLEKRYLRKDGAVFWMSLAVSLRRDAAGAPAYVISVLQDISGRKRLEEELNQALARLELAVRGSNITLLELNMPDGVLENSNLELISHWFPWKSTLSPPTLRSIPVLRNRQAAPESR